jgi:hypothetical protein
MSEKLGTAGPETRFLGENGFLNSGVGFLLARQSGGLS